MNYAGTCGISYLTGPGNWGVIRLMLGVIISSIRAAFVGQHMTRNDTFTVTSVEAKAWDNASGVRS